MPFNSSGRRDLNPGPLLPTYLTDWGLFDRNELSAHCPESSQLRQSGTTDLVGDWLGIENYDRRRRIIANAPKPTAQSERAEGSGTPLIVIPEFGIELKAAS